VCAQSFDPTRYTDETLTAGQQTIHFRAYRDIPYVSKPSAPELQILNIFIPQTYIEGGEINGYTAKTAPIFFPNAIGAYFEALPCSPGVREDGSLNTEAAALAHGYVVISAGARGRTTESEGRYTGKAPACIADLKAAVRFIRSIAHKICGDTGRIISNGTSAGGAMSALLGASGNAPEYEPYLEEIGAQQGDDSIFAASCYCPITNLEHSDMAYEWQYGHLDTRHWDNWRPGEDGVWRPVPMTEALTPEQMDYSARLAARFHDYVNTVPISGMDMDGLTGLICEKLLQSARRAETEGKDIPLHSGIMLSADHIDLRSYSQYITRMKPPGAFDSPAMNTWENQLFGTEHSDFRHFTEAAAEEDAAGGECAPGHIVGMMNAMNYLGNPGCAKYWRIRHGAADRDTSFAVSAMLAAGLEAKGKNVDYFLPWGLPHSGDYDLEELFGWIDAVCAGEGEKE